MMGSKLFPSLGLIIPVLLVAVLLAGYAEARGVNQKPEAFLREAFAGQGQPPAPNMLWLTGELKQAVAKILQHPYHKLRIKYWRKDGRSVWVLDEIGKEKPITTGIVINNGTIEYLKVLVFRESRGWEVEQGFFTRQFNQARLVDDLSLDRDIDGITGATLSVRAVDKLARLALFLDRRIQAEAGAGQP
jgi:hypothetical protein